MSDTDHEEMEEYLSYADELEAKESGKPAKKKKTDGDTDKTDNQGDQGSAAGTAPPPQPQVNEEEVKQNWLEKLKLIFIAPFSQIIPGTVAYTAENDLSKKAFFLRVGLYNRQIEPTDIADPNLIQKLEDRHQERRERYGLGPSVALEYLRPKPKGPGAPAAPGGLGLGTSEGGEGDSGSGGATGIKPVTEGGVSAAAVEKAQIKNASIEERDLMATGASIDEAKAEIDEYLTPEEFIQEISEQSAFSQIDPTAELMLLQAFNTLAAQTKENVPDVKLRRKLRLSKRDGGQESTPSFLNRDNT